VNFSALGPDPPLGLGRLVPGNYAGVDTRLLGVYLNDHLAGSIGGEELAKRCLSHNRHSPLGDYLSRFVVEVREDRGTLERLMDRLAVSRDLLKPRASWLLEKLGRFKLNGGVLRYTELSRLEELEGLCLGVEGKACMWRALGNAPLDVPGGQEFDMGALEARAQRQREQLELYRLEAARRLVTENDA
jgi:hypothetical protein